MSKTTPLRARSRLAKGESKKSSTLPAASTPVESRHRKTASVSKLHTTFSSVGFAADWQVWLNKHRLHLMLVAVSAISVALLLMKVSPSKVANVGLADTYLPFLLLIALFTFASARLVVQHRRAVVAAAIITLLIFTRVHAVVFPSSYYFLIGGIIILCELLALLVKKR